MNTTALKKTPINAVHREMKAKMVPFGGWDMPVEYAGLISEHLAVRKAAGLFDVSHMGELFVEGAGAQAFLQRVTSNDVAKLIDGQAQYSALPMPSGCPVDDIIVYRFGAEKLMLIVNAGNLEKDWAWLNAQKPEGCTLTNRSDDTALMALQGPLSQEILQGLTATDLSGIAFYHFGLGDVAGVPSTISRTGYTGEDGFEIGVPADKAEIVWRRLLDEGKERGLVPAGLGARDTLRLEAKMALYGNDIDESTTLVEAGLGWIVSVAESKGDFNGRGVLEPQKQGGTARKLAGFEMTGRGIARHHYPVFVDGHRFGDVTSGSYAPFLQKNIGLCYLPSAKAIPDSVIELEIRGVRVAAKVVPTPFYKRQK